MCPLTTGVQVVSYCRLSLSSPIIPLPPIVFIERAEVARYGGGRDGGRIDGGGRDGGVRQGEGREGREGQVEGNDACGLNWCYSGRGEVLLGLGEVGMTDESGVRGGSEVVL